MLRIDLNADIGEGYGNFTKGEDEQLLTVITSANIACGFHAGDYNTIPHTIKLAKKNGVGIGAHPGFQDVFGFGRRNMYLSPNEIYHLILYQLGTIYAFCKVENVPLVHVKPHGALYNLASKDYQTAKAIVDAVYDFNPQLTLFALSHSELLKAGLDKGLPVAAEGFADRTYTKEGHLTSRSEKNSTLTTFESIKKQVTEMVIDKKVTTVDGEQVEMKIDTICFHGDQRDVYDHSQKIKQLLKELGVEVKKIGE